MVERAKLKSQNIQGRKSYILVLHQTLRRDNLMLLSRNQIGKLPNTTIKIQTGRPVKINYGSTI